MAKNLSVDQQALVEQWQVSHDQLQKIEDIAAMFQELLGTIDDTKHTDLNKTKQFAALLTDMRESLSEIKNKEMPKMPDHKPVVDAINNLDKAFSKALKSINFSPKIDVSSPDVKVDIPKVDLSGIEKVLKTDIIQAFNTAINSIKIPTTDNKPLTERLDKVLAQLVDIDTGVRLKPQPGTTGILVNGAPVSNLNPLPTKNNTGDSPINPTFVDIEADTSLFGAQIVESERQYAAGVFDTTANMNVTTYDNSANGGSTAATSANLVIQSGTTATGKGERISKTQIIYVPGQEGRAKFTAVFDSATIGAKQQIGFISDTDGAYLEKDGSGLSLVHLRNSIEFAKLYSVDWNGDLSTQFTKDGVVVPFTDTVGRIYRISFGYLGYLGIRWQVLSPDKKWVTMHTEYYDDQTVPIFISTTLDFRWRVIKTSGATNVTLKSGSFNVSTIGERNPLLISSENSTETALGANATFTGDWFCHEGYVSLELNIKTDQLSASNGIVIEFSERGDAVTSFKSKRLDTFSASDVTNGFKRVIIPPELSFTRITYTNGGTIQGSMFMETRFHSVALELPRGGIEATINAANTALMTRGVTFGADTTGTYRNATVTQADASNRTGQHVGIMKQDVELQSKSLSSGSFSNASVTSTASQLDVSALTNRKYVLIANADNNTTLYYGFTSAVTTSNGMPLAPGVAHQHELDPTVQIWAIVATGTVSARLIQVAGTV